MNDNRTLGQKVADIASSYIGSWRFIITFNSLLTVWVIINGAMGKDAIDPFPYILLNLMLSWMAGVQAPLIMLSQRRQDEMQKQTIQDISSIARATLEIAGAVREQLQEHTEMLEHIEDIHEDINNKEIK